MSDYLSFEIVEEIIKRLPVKSVIRFRSVSKQWKSLIESSKFIIAYGIHQCHSHRLLVRYKDPLENDDDERFFTAVDDDTFSDRQDVDPTFLMLTNLAGYRHVVGSSHGLLCFFVSYEGNNHRYNVAFIWNPSIRKSIAIVVPDVFDLDFTFLGFGVCPITNDPKIVRINQGHNWCTMTMNKCILREVKIFRLSTGRWSSSRNLPRKSIAVKWSQEFIDGFIYWLSVDLEDGRNMILSFDVTHEEFRAIDLPYSLSKHDKLLSVAKLRESLVVLERSYDTLEKACDVWMMNDGVFTKLLMVEQPLLSKMIVVGFRKSGQPIVELFDMDHHRTWMDYELCALGLYESYSKHTKNLGIYGRIGSFYVCTFTETLLLLNQSNGTIYSDVD